MRQRLACAALLLIWTASCQELPSELARAQAQLIDGTDDRVEYGGASTLLRRIADATPQIVLTDRVTCGTGGICVLHTSPWTSGATGGAAGGASGNGGAGGAGGSAGTGGPQRLCDGVRFRGQPSLKGCSAVLVGPRIIATSMTCADSASCPSWSAVFGFKADADGSHVPSSVPADSAFQCVRVTPPTSSGWVLATLDRDVPREIQMAAPPADPVDTPVDVTMIGYPFGLPEKISPSGKLTSTGLFIDAFKGNEGGPVVDTATGLVLGVLAVPPPSDFTPSTDASGPCQTEKVSPPQSVALQLARATPNAAPVLLTPDLIVASLP